MHAILDSTPTLIFLSIAVASFIFVCGSFLTGHDHDTDHHVDHGNEPAGHDFATVNIFSTKIIALFGLAFGAGGGAACLYGLNILLSTLIGLVCGFLLGLAAYLALKLLYQQQVNSLVTDASLVGCFGQVVTRIPADGNGEVTFVSRGQSLTQLAVSIDHTELKVGTRVRIVRSGGHALQVEEAKD